LERLDRPAGAPEHLADRDVATRLLDLVLDQALLRQLRDRTVAHAAHARGRVGTLRDQLARERDGALVEPRELRAACPVDAAGETVELRTLAQHLLGQR